MTISAVKGSDPSRLADGAAQLRGEIKQLDELIFDQRRVLHQLGDGWDGTAADAAKAKGEALVQQHEALKTRLTAMQSALESAGTSLTALRGSITGMVQQVFALGGTVSDDGTATSTGTGRTFTPQLAAAYTSILKSLLQQFSAVDEAAWPHFPNLEPGTFELELIITASGQVLAVIPRCEPPFCEAADAFAGVVRQWMFRAAERQGEPVASRMRIEFQINQPPPRSEAQPARQ